jgi:hypothetical protein
MSLAGINVGSLVRYRDGLGTVSKLGSIGGDDVVWLEGVGGFFLPSELEVADDHEIVGDPEWGNAEAIDRDVGISR